MKIIRRISSGDSFKWKKFKVIPEHKVVVGEMRRIPLMRELNDLCSLAELSCMPINIVEDADDFDAYNIAKAKCDPRDEWSEKIGVDVASAKLDLKEHLRKVRKLEKGLVVMNSAMRKMEDLLNKHMKKAKAIEEDLKNYYGRE